jgi:putative heme-binding domain-containing protein
MIWVLLLLAQSATPTQIERGEALFFDTAHGCGGCHALRGKGTAVGPDLKGVAHLSAKGVAMAVRSTVTQYVQIVKLKDGRSFPAMPPQGDKVYDLSKTPPEAVPAAAADIASMTANNGWKHPASGMKLTDQQIADLVAYIRFAGANNRQAVAPDDIK